MNHPMVTKGRVFWYPVLKMQAGLLLGLKVLICVHFSVYKQHKCIFLYFCCLMLSDHPIIVPRPSTLTEFKPH
jgi:hypothetical protein